jgi:ABC-2 type transport system permease protein
VAGMSGEPAFGPLAKAQLAAVLQMRWRMLVNSLRSRVGRFELGARIFATVFFGIVWIGVGLGCGAAAYLIAANHQFKFLPALLWPIFLMWQVVPILLSAAQESVDFNFLLRFPVSFRSYLLLYLSFGVFDPSSMLGGICLLGVWCGIVLGGPGLILWITVALAIFAAFNFLLTRMIFAWLERWLAQRKTREILGILSFVLLISFQFLNPALHSHGHAINRAATFHTLTVVQKVQQFFPPGLAGDAVAMAASGQSATALTFLSGLLLYAGVVGALLALRLRAEFRGESFGEAPARTENKRAVATAPRNGENVESPSRQHSWLDGAIGGILVKELRYLSRSGVMLFGLVTPLVLILAMGGGLNRSVGGAGSGLERPGGGIPIQFIFPIAIAYGFLPLTRQFCNSLGTEGAGIQLYFLSPTPFRTVMLAKNLLQTGLFCGELLLVALTAVYRFGIPPERLAIATFCWVLFALPANLAAGNILSITLAYRMTLTRLAREQGSVGNGLLSLLIQLVIFAIGVAVYVPLAIVHRAEFAAPIFLVLAAGSWLVWRRVLSNVDGMAAGRREALMATLVRPA